MRNEISCCSSKHQTLLRWAVRGALLSLELGYTAMYLQSRVIEFFARRSHLAVLEV